MKAGKTLQELAIEVDRQRESKRDFVARTDALEMLFDTEKEFSGTNPYLGLDVGGLALVGVNGLAHDQIAGHTHIPRPYYDRLLQKAPRLLTQNVNHWFKTAATEEKRMVRTLDGHARAFLSNSYRPLDNVDFMEACLPPLLKMGVEVMSCEVTEKRLYLKVVDQRIKKDLPVGARLGEGHVQFRTISPALVLSNSEVGSGALSVLTSVWEGGCTNLMVLQERSQRKYHLGGRQDVGEIAYDSWRDETKRITDKALWMQVQDTVEAAFNQAQFDAIHAKLVDASRAQITTDPVKAVEVTAKKFGFTDTERGSVLNYLIRGGDMSQYGLQWAITRAGQDVDSYDRASEFERIGGAVIELPQKDWKEIALAKAA